MSLKKPPKNLAEKPTNKRYTTLIILVAIQDYVDQNERPPTQEDLRKAINATTKSAVRYHLVKAEKLNWLRIDHETSRGLRLTPLGKTQVDAERALRMKSEGGNQ